MSIPLTDRTKLNALIPNLEVGQTADPELRQNVFQEIYVYMDGLATAINGLSLNSNNVDGGNFTDSFYLFFRNFDGGNFADSSSSYINTIDGGAF